MAEPVQRCLLSKMLEKRSSITLLCIIKGVVGLSRFGGKVIFIEKDEVSLSIASIPIWFMERSAPLVLWSAAPEACTRPVHASVLSGKVHQDISWQYRQNLVG